MNDSKNSAPPESPTDLTKGQHHIFVLETESFDDCLEVCKEKGLKFLNARKLRGVLPDNIDKEESPLYLTIKNGKARRIPKGFKEIIIDKFYWLVKTMKEVKDAKA